RGAIWIFDVDLPMSPLVKTALDTCELTAGYWVAVHQPQALGEEDEQQKSGRELRCSESFAGEEFRHLAEPSVLPCQRLRRRKFFMDEDRSSLGSPPPGESISGQELPPPPAPAPSLLQTIFFGPYGLRAGW